MQIHLQRRTYIIMTSSGLQKPAKRKLAGLDRQVQELMKTLALRRIYKEDGDGRRTLMTKTEFQEEVGDIDEHSFSCKRQRSYAFFEHIFSKL